MMTLTSMDETMSETEPATKAAPISPEEAPQPVPAAEFDATPWPVPSRPAPRRPPVRFSMPRGPRLWTVALAGALLFTTGGLALLYLDDTSFQNTAAQVSGQNKALQAQNKALATQLAATQTNLTATLGELATVKAELEHPTLTIWNVNQVLKDRTWYLAGGIPDTFTYHLKATSNGPMTVSILTFEQWGKAVECIDHGVGDTNYCMHHSGTDITWTNVTTLDYDFHKAEGCADYLSVFTTSGTNVTVTPNVSVSYNPASSSTGACA
jgi:hypothetical protein